MLRSLIRRFLITVEMRRKPKESTQFIKMRVFLNTSKAKVKYVQLLGVKWEDMSQRIGYCVDPSFILIVPETCLNMPET